MVTIPIEVNPLTVSMVKSLRGLCIVIHPVAIVSFLLDEYRDALDSNIQNFSWNNVLLDILCTIWPDSELDNAQFRRFATAKLSLDESFEK